ncbi:MAG: hypothetical protein ACI4K5_01795 [Ruminococcus sp.]
MEEKNYREYIETEQKISDISFDGGKSFSEKKYWKAPSKPYIVIEWFRKEKYILAEVIGEKNACLLCRHIKSTEFDLEFSLTNLNIGWNEKSGYAVIKYKNLESFTENRYELVYDEILNSEAKAYFKAKKKEQKQKRKENNSD